MYKITSIYQSKRTLFSGANFSSRCVGNALSTTEGFNISSSGLFECCSVRITEIKRSMNWMGNIGSQLKYEWQVYRHWIRTMHKFSCHLSNLGNHRSGSGADPDGFLGSKFFGSLCLCFLWRFVLAPCKLYAFLFWMLSTAAEKTRDDSNNLNNSEAVWAEARSRGIGMAATSSGSE